MATDRRREFAEKANELQADKQELEARGQEIAAQNQENATNNGVDAGSAVQTENGNTDRRQEFSAKTAELVQMQQEFQTGKDELVRKSNAGMDSGDENTASTEPVIQVTKERVREFTEILEKYKKGKANLDARIRNNQDWWKLRHYGNMSPKEGTAAVKDQSQINDARPKSVTAWTVNAVINKHADYMDNYPEPIVLPQEASDKEYAHKLSSVLPALYERLNHEQTYSDEMWYKLIAGTCVESHTWNNNLQNGLGDIDINKCDILNLFWEPGITDIQDSEYFFHTRLISNNKIRNMFPDIPELKTQLSNPTVDVTRYNYDDTIDTADHSLVIDVYYHKQNSAGKSVLHYCKYVNDIVLFASENIEQYAETGYYAHNKYPYVFDTLFPVEGSPCGFGYIDIVKEVQKDIDELNDDFMHNAKQASRKRYAVSNSSGVNEKELADFTNEVIHCEGSGLDNNNFKEIQASPLSNVYLSLLDYRINEIKEVSNNRDVSSGGTISGVTAASAIAAMQEAGSKTSRDQEASSYRAFKEGCYLDIELMGQFYDETRYFRITGENGEEEFVGFNNAGIKSQVSKDANGNELSRKPVFDIKVSPQKKSQYTKLSQNELMKELYSLGAFNPQNATQAQMLVSNMDFEGKDMLLSQISKNGTVFNMLLQYQQIVLAMAQYIDYLTGSQYTVQVQMAIQNGQVPMISLPSSGGSSQTESQTDTNGNAIVDNAREQARQRAEVRR